MSTLAKDFPNGFESWYETFFDITQAITMYMNDESYDQDQKGLIEDRQREQGIGGMYELTRELTDEFELKSQGVVWGEEAEYFDTIEEFINEKFN
jgi:hypothetical protein